MARRTHLRTAVVVLSAVVALFLGAPQLLIPASAAGNPAANLDQCANGAVGAAPERCEGAAWVNGNLNGSKAHYREGESVPYRARLTDLTVGASHTLSIEWDTTKGGVHALDYLTTYNRTETNALPTSGVSGLDPTSFSTYPIPADLGMQARADWSGTQVPGAFTLFGGTITGVSSYTFTGAWTGDSSTGITITFTADMANPVLAWGGHIASRVDWGRGGSAASIPGSPFHMRVIALDGSGGNQDRSLSNDAVIFPASITITKDARPDGPKVFSFTASPAPLTSFTLVDDGDPTAPVATTTFSGIETFGTYTVTEAAETGWTLSGLACVDATGGSTTSSATRTATIGLAEADEVTCTFTNTRNASITVDKTASPTTVPEPGGAVTFDVTITNDSTVSSVTITTLTDSVYGSITAVAGSVSATTCAVPQTIAALGSYQCSFTALVSGDAGSSHTDTVTASGTDALGNPVSDSDDATVTVSDVVPVVVALKSVTPTTLPEPGGNATFTVDVTNPSTAVESISLTSLVDDVYGNLDGKGTCDVTPAVTLAPGATYSCTFTGAVAGDAGSVHTDTVTATARDNEGNSVTGSDSATVTITDVLPTVTVDKTASPTTLPEPGGNATFTVTVANPVGAVETIWVTNLVDSVYGNLNGKGTCDVTPPVALAPGASYSCTFTGAVSGDAGSVHTDTVTATAVDNEGNQATDTDDATVTITDVRPTVTVDKTASPTTLPEPGGNATFTVTAANPASAVETIWVTDLVDSVYGNLNGKGTCDVTPAVPLAPGASYTCTFTGAVTGDAGSVHTDTVTATAVDNEGNHATDADDATVTITDVLPAVEVTKTASPTSLPEPGGNATFTVVVTNPAAAVEPISLTTLVDSVYGNLDGKGTCDVTPAVSLTPGASYTCAFTGAVSGDAGSVHTDTVTATAVDNEGNHATDADDATVTLTDVLPAITVQKTVAPATVPEPGATATFTVTVRNPVSAVEAVQLTSLVDSVYGNLDGKGSCDVTPPVTIVPGGSYTCTFTGAVTGDAGSTHTDVVTATARDNEGNLATATDDATVTITDVLPAVEVQKFASPASLSEPGGNATFTITVTNPASAVETISLTSLVDSVYGNLDGKGTCDVTPPVSLAPGATYTCAFTGAVTGDAGSSHTDTVTATARDNENNQATDTASATVTITDVRPTVDVTKTASPTTLPEPGGNATFTVVVTNPASAVENISLSSLVDSVYGNLDGKGTCDVTPPVALSPGATYSCSFTGAVAGDAGSVHTDTVTATARDNENNQATDTDDAVVTITDVLPTVTVDKTAAPTSLPEPGGNVTFTVVVTNPASAVESISVTNLVDSVYGNLNGKGTCDVTPAVSLAPGGRYTCTFTGAVTGDAGSTHTDVVTATAVDNEGNVATDTDDATVTITDVLPAVTVAKTASPTSLPEPGGNATFTVTVTNPATAVESIFVTKLVDDVYGDLDGKGTCDLTPAVSLAPGASYSCTFTGAVAGDAGSKHTDVVTVTAIDNEENPATAADDATVTITDVVPTVEVVKTAAPTSLPEPGGNATFTVTVTNPATAVESILVTKLVDDVYGDLDGKGTCDVSPPVPLAPGAGFTCTFTGAVAGDAGSAHTDVVTATAADNEGNQATDTDDATVTLTDVLPTIVLEKAASPTIVRTGDPVTYTYTVTNGGVEPILEVAVTDDRCSPVGFSGGDTDGDQALDPGETWTFTCTASLTGTTVNVAVASGHDNEGNPTTATDQARVLVINPLISIIKTPSADVVAPGDLVSYVYVVTNPGSDALADITVTDDRCGPVAYETGDTDGDGLLDVNETWTFRCTVTAPASAGPLTNVGTVHGTDRLGGAVSASDSATVNVVAVQVLAVELTRTGEPITTLVAGAFALVAIGGLLVLVTRRRTPHRTA